MNKPTTPKPTEEQVQACYIWLERAAQDTDRWMHAMDLLLAWSKANYQRVKNNDYCAAEILAAAFEWERWEASEDKARLDLLEKNECNGGTLSMPDMSGVTHRIHVGAGKPIRATSFRAAIDQARKETT